MNKKSVVAFICLGSNLGDKIANIKSALKLLEREGIIAEKISSFYLTEPVEVEGQPWFFNLVARITTYLSPEELLGVCQKTEEALGRQRRGDKSPRTIDIDILLYGDEVFEKPDLQIPHPRMHLRRFMLEPLCEIAPFIEHPVKKKKISQLLKKVRDTSMVIKSEEYNDYPL